MRYLLLIAVLLAGCTKPSSISSQFNEVEYRSAVVRWKVKEAEIQISLDEGAVVKAEADFEKASKEWDRAQKLLPQSAISQTDYDVARFNFIETQQALGAAKLTVELDKYRWEEMKALLEQALLFESKAASAARQAEHGGKPHG
jgi:multidrug resistance efflux pump